MGTLYFKNQDDEWEQYPDEETKAIIRQNAEYLEILGLSIICQMCNEPPTLRQIKDRARLHEWTCDKCHTVNSAGKA